ncbi:MAG: peptide ABC transporter substrate-binding protein [Oscillospiraceae bacterium]|jgi:oligopeptide transport system substrate-binding protein|nr:peptide ABC transporter substrate-binding protein [Oscillospiraceae bacterium]
MRKLLLVILSLGLLLSLTGCPGTQEPAVTPQASPSPRPTPQEPEETVLEVCLGVEWYTIDPTFINDEDTASCALHLFEGLMKYVPSEEGTQVSQARVEYGMAEGYTVSEDGLTYTFTLRKDAKWSDGAAVTAEDFVYAWRRVLEPDRTASMEHARGGHVFSGLVKNAEQVERGALAVTELGVTALDARTLEVRLERPCTYFPKLCAAPSLVPLRQDVIEAYGGDWTDADKIVTNGPYRVTEWVHDDYLKMEQNPYYYDRDSLGPDTLVWQFSDGEQLTLDAFQAGTYDLIATFPEEQTAALRESGVFHTQPKAGTYYLYLNTDAIADWRVRAAMVLSVDRDAIAETLGGDVQPATGLVAAGIQDGTGGEFASGGSGAAGAMFNWLQNWHQDYDLSTYEGRCALAKTLYQDALHAGSWHRSYQVSYCYNSSTMNRTVAQTCQKNWRDVLGLTVNLSVVDQSAYPSLLEDGGFGVAYLSWMPDYDDAQNFLQLMESGSGYNYSNWKSPAFDDLMAQIGECLDVTQRDELQYYAEEQLFALGGFPVCPVLFYGESYCASAELHDVAYSPFGYYIFSYAGK